MNLRTIIAVLILVVSLSSLIGISFNYSSLEQTTYSVLSLIAVVGISVFYLYKQTRSDISRLRQLEEKLRTQSFTDELTGLLNRRGFFTLMDYQLKIASRQKKEAFMLYVDVDNLKWINDTWGHQEGDRALAETADILKETFRESDIIARLGGDEFVVFYAETPYENFETISERLEKNLEAYNSKHHRGYKPLLSTGIAEYDPANPVSLDKLLYEAERLMYVQKRQKENPK